MLCENDIDKLEFMIKLVKLREIPVTAFTYLAEREASREGKMLYLVKLASLELLVR